jgi:hypothetical protein
MNSGGDTIFTLEQEYLDGLRSDPFVQWPQLWKHGKCPAIGILSLLHKEGRGGVCPSLTSGKGLRSP